MPLGSHQGLGGDIGSLKPPRVEDQATGNMLSGYGAPSNNIGVNGQVYIRLDGSSNTRLYQKVGGSWVALTTG